MNEASNFQKQRVPGWVVGSILNGLRVRSIRRRNVVRFGSNLTWTEWKVTTGQKEQVENPSLPEENRQMDVSHVE